VDGKTYALDDFENAKVLVVFFTCNHCPYVIGSEDRILALHDAYHPKGVDWVGINSSETQNHPTDDFGHMKQRAAEKGIRYPYLRDESQEVARSCDAPRTPHFYVFDADRRLRYTGRLDDRPRDASAASTHELRDAPDAVPPWQDPPVPRTNPIGCNVKWRGKEEHWMPPEACDLVQAVARTPKQANPGDSPMEADEARRESSTIEARIGFIRHSLGGGACGRGRVACRGHPAREYRGPLGRGTAGRGQDALVTRGRDARDTATLARRGALPAARRRGSVPGAPIEHMEIPMPAQDPTRDDALSLLQEYNHEERAIKHALAVEAVMRYMAALRGGEADRWGIVGLIHDLDYEQFPDEHCAKSREILQQRGWPEDIIRAVVSHGWGICSDVEPASDMEKTLYAVDELTGLITAAALVRPSRSVTDLTPKSVLKKWKDKRFAAGVDRDVIDRGAAMLGLERRELIEQTIEGMRTAADELGLAGQGEPTT